MAIPCPQKPPHAGAYFHGSALKVARLAAEAKWNSYAVSCIRCPVLLDLSVLVRLKANFGLPSTPEALAGREW